MSLANASSDTISLDYLLTRVGSEPRRERLMAHALKETGCIDSDPGFCNLCNLHENSWGAFVQEVQSKYDSFEGYAMQRLGFSMEDIIEIRGNLCT